MARTDSAGGGCPRSIRRRLALFATDDLPAKWERIVAGHVASCAPCREEAEVWRRQAERLTALRRAPEDAPLSALFWNGVRKEIAEDPVPIDRLRARRSRRVRFTAAAAAVIVVACLGITVMSFLGGGGAPVGPATEADEGIAFTTDPLEPEGAPPIMPGPPDAGDGFGATPERDVFEPPTPEFPL